MPQDISATRLEAGGVRRDWVDLRDQSYLPTLSVLRASVSLDPRLMLPDPTTDRNTPIFGVRDQGDSGRCVGYALASLIDIQRNLQWPDLPPAKADRAAEEARRRRDIASADMLYHMAYFHDRYPDPAETDGHHREGVRTLRSAIKGFYHHGACLDWPENAPPDDPARWQSTSFNSQSRDSARRFQSVAQAKKAREIGLGAYFRLASVLNHFHAALNEAGSILVTANIHDGWLRAVPQTGGVIEWPPRQGKWGTHAFVLTGYDADGFHVLNSWGTGWGGYRKQAGIGLWHYADWAQNVVDAWVLRLGIPAPAAFDVSMGEHGTKGLAGRVRTGSTPCFELLGHYMHLDDGYHVCSGSYPSFPESWPTTHEYLTGELTVAEGTGGAEPPWYRGLLISIPGSLEGIKTAFKRSVEQKNDIKALRLYPYSIFWCNNFVEKSLEVLEIIFESCKAQAGENAAHLDSLIEQRVQGVGRAFWRDIELAARRALHGTTELPFEPEEDDRAAQVAPGHAAHFFADVMRLKAETGCEVHLVAEGAGALVLHELLTLLDEDADKPASERLFPCHDLDRLFDTLHLVHPAIGLPRARKRILPLLSAMNARPCEKAMLPEGREPAAVQPLVAAGAGTRARLYLPTPEFEQRIRFGSYHKSILHLVARAFEDRQPAPAVAGGAEPPHLRPPRRFLGMACIGEDPDFPARRAIFRQSRIEAQPHPHDPVSQTALTRDGTVTKSIFESIKTLHEKKTPGDGRKHAWQR